MQKILQLYYTSCRKGLTAGSGFQTYSKSEEITKNEQREIEKLGLYAPPLNLPSQPTEEEIRNNFPDSFSFYRLSSGRYCILSSNYVGLDHTNRYGNYFCHALVLNEGQFPFYPIELFNSPFFKHNLSSEELNITYKPSPLPDIRIEDLETTGNINFQAISSFFDEDHRIDTLKKIIDSVLLSKKNNRPLVICDTQDLIPFWFAAVQMAFPIEMAHQLTFTTYTINPEYVPAKLMATFSSGSKFTFSNLQINSQYYVFNIVENQFSPISENSSLSNLIATSYEYSHELLEMYHKFFNQFIMHEISWELDDAYHLFQMVNQGIKELDHKDIVGAINYANLYAKPEALATLTKQLNEILLSLNTALDLHSAEVITQFLFNLSVKLNDANIYDRACILFYTSLVQLTENHDEEQIFIFIKKIDGFAKEAEKKFNFVLFNSKYLTFFQKILQENDTQRIKLCFDIALKFFYNPQNANKVLQDSDLINFMTDCLAHLSQNKNIFVQILNNISNNISLFSTIIKIAYDTSKQNEETLFTISQSILLSESSQTQEWKSDVRKEIIRKKYYDLSFRMLSIELEANNYNSMYFWNYCKTYFYRNKDFRDLYFGEILHKFFSNKRFDKNIDQAYYDFYQVSQYILLLSIKEKSIVLDIIEEFELFILKNPPKLKKNKDKEENPYELIKDINKLKRKFDIKTVPDITGIELLKYQIILSQLPLTFDNLTLPSLSGLSIEDYSKLLITTLPKIIKIMKRSKDHKDLLTAFYVGNNEEYIETLSTKYIDILIQKSTYSNNKKDDSRNLNSSYQTSIYRFLIFFYSKHFFIGNEEQIIRNYMKPYFEKKILSDLQPFIEQFNNQIKNKSKRNESFYNESFYEDWKLIYQKYQNIITYQKDSINQKEKRSIFSRFFRSKIKPDKPTL